MARTSIASFPATPREPLAGACLLVVQQCHPSRRLLHRPAWRRYDRGATAFWLLFWTGNDKVDRAAEGMAKSFGLPYLVLSDRKAIAGATHMEAAEWRTRHIGRSGDQGVWDDDTVQILTDGLHRVLAHLEMTAPEPAVSEPKRYEAWSWLRSEHNGVYYPAVKVGEHVTVGQDLGRVADVFGNTLQALQALAKWSRPISGYVLGHEQRRSAVGNRRIGELTPRIETGLHASGCQYRLD